MAVQKKDAIQSEFRIDTTDAMKSIAQVKDATQDYLVIAKKLSDKSNKSTAKALKLNTSIFKVQARMPKSLTASNRKAQKALEKQKKAQEELLDATRRLYKLEKGPARVKGKFASKEEHGRQVIAAAGDVKKSQAAHESAIKELNVATRPERAAEMLGDVAKNFGKEGGTAHNAVGSVFGDKIGGGAAGKAMTESLSNGFSSLIKGIEGATGAFEMVATAVELLTGPIGIAVLALSAMVKLFFAVDAKMADFNKTMLKGVGAGGTKDLKQDYATKASLMLSNTDTSGLSKSLMLTSDGIDHMMSSLKQAGVGAADLKEGVTTTATAAWNFGMSMEEAAEKSADYYKSYGKSMASISSTFATLSSDIKGSGMTAVNFLGILQSVTSQMNLFLDSTKELSKSIAAIGKSGAYSQKQVGAMMEAMTSGGTMDIEKSQSMIAMFGKNKKVQKDIHQLKAIAQKDLATAKVDGKSNEAQLLALQNTIEGYDKILSGNILDGATMLNETMSPMQIVATQMDGLGVTSVETAEATMSNGESLAKAAAYLQVSQDQARLMLKGQQALYAAAEEAGVKTGDTAGYIKWLATDQGKAASNQKDAADSAAKVAAMSTSKIAGLGEVTNGLLSAILSVLKGTNKKADLVSGMDDLNKSAQALKDVSKSSATDYETKASTRIRDAKERTTGGGTKAAQEMFDKSAAKEQFTSNFEAISKDFAAQAASAPRKPGVPSYVGGYKPMVSDAASVSGTTSAATAATTDAVTDALSGQAGSSKNNVKVTITTDMPWMAQKIKTELYKADSH